MISIPELSPPETRKAERGGEVHRIYCLLKSWLIECKLSPGDVL